MPAVDDLLQRHVDDSDTALDWNRGGRASPFRILTNVRDVSQRSHHVAQLGAGPAVDVSGVDLGFVILRCQTRCQQR